MNESCDQESRLAASLAWCKQTCKASGSSFYPAFRLLDRPRRNAMYALYAFARITDDLGDSTASVERRREQLLQWRGRTADVLSGAAGSILDLDAPVLVSYEQLWPQLQYSASRFGMPSKYFDELIQGVMLDLEHKHPADWQATDNYCYHVATTVGLLCTYIWREDPAEAPDADLAHQCGIAFQLTNILRDVAEDAAMGRIYLPSEELERYGVDAQAWLSGRPNGNWPDLISSVGARARTAYDAGWAVGRGLSPRSSGMFMLMWRSYRQLLENVESNKGQLWGGGRTGLTRMQKLRLLSQALRPAQTWQPAVPR